MAGMIEKPLSPFVQWDIALNTLWFCAAVYRLLPGYSVSVPVARGQFQGWAALWLAPFFANIDICGLFGIKVWQVNPVPLILIIS